MDVRGGVICSTRGLSRQQLALLIVVWNFTVGVAAAEEWHGRVDREAGGPGAHIAVGAIRLPPQQEAPGDHVCMIYLWCACLEQA